MRTDRYISRRNDTGSDSSGGRRNHSKKKGNRLLRTLLVIIPLLAVAAAGLVVYSYKTTKDSLDLSFTEDSPDLEFGGEYKAMDYVKASVGEVSSSEKLLDAETTGDKTITYTVTEPLFGGLLNPSREFTLEYTVVDSVSPIILWNGTGTVLERGTEFDINNVLGFGDNADPEPSIQIDGEVDMSKNGRYPLHITVTDASGNSEKCDLTVEVADTVPVYNDTSVRTQFRDFVSSYAGKGRSFGIDISTWQRDVDFEALKAAGCDFVIMRIGYSVDGKVETDGKFDQNFERVKKSGLKYGVYLYSYDNTEEKARESARWIIEKLGGEVPELPVVFDWEDFGRFQTYKMSFAGLNSMYDAFADELSSAGYEAMLYGSKNFLEKVWENTDTRPVWLAHYTDKTDYKGPYRIWQASCTGRIDGIDGDVDMDIMYE